jgi:site-specific recombinase XerD
MELKNLSPRTVESYLNAVVKLANHYNKSPALITQEMIYQYSLFLQKEEKKEFSTCNIALSAFKCFYNQFPGNGTIMFTVPSRRGPRKLPVIYSQEEVHRIIQSAGSPKYRLAFMTAYGSGLRLGELLNLKVSDIDSDRMTIVVKSGKGNRDRHALLPKSLLNELTPYYRLFRPESWLFYSTSKDRKLSQDSVSRAFKEAKRKAGVTREGGMHTLRHCFATHLLEAGTDIKTLQHLLGHAEISSTMVYLHVTNKLVLSVVSPLDATPCDEVDPFAKRKAEKKEGDDE